MATGGCEVSCCFFKSPLTGCLIFLYNDGNKRQNKRQHHSGHAAGYDGLGSGAQSLYSRRDTKQEILTLNYTYSIWQQRI